MYADAKERDKVLNDMIIEALDKEMKDCMFEPQLPVPKSSRGFNEFWKEQQERAKKKGENVTRLRVEQDQREFRLHQRTPTISPVCVDIYNFA